MCVDIKPAPNRCVTPSLLSTSKGKAATRLRRILARDGVFCFWCKEAFACTVEHLLPEYLGGTAHLDNLKGACQPCNHSRGKRLSGPDPVKVRVLRASRALSRT